jgi:D-3-phosphoglycerate dehydrogenase
MPAPRIGLLLQVDKPRLKVDNLMLHGQAGSIKLPVIKLVEPLPADSPLMRMDNVMLAPHNANSSPVAWERVHWNTIYNLLTGLGIDHEKGKEN